MQCASSSMRGLVVLIVLVGSMSLCGCSEDVQQTIASDVNNQSFTFASGAVFNPALANIATTLSFSNDAANFGLSSAGGAATGVTTFGNACTLTVTISTYTIGTGPQVNDVISLAPCDFDTSSKVLLVGNGTITATSAPAVPTGT